MNRPTASPPARRAKQARHTSEGPPLSRETGCPPASSWDHPVLSRVRALIGILSHLRRCCQPQDRRISSWPKKTCRIRFLGIMRFPDMTGSAGARGGPGALYNLGYSFLVEWTLSPGIMTMSRIFKQSALLPETVKNPNAQGRISSFAVRGRKKWPRSMHFSS